MQATNGEVWQAREAVSSLLEQKLPVKTAYWVAKLARKLGEQARDIDVVRVKLIREYGTQDEKGNVTVSPESEQYPAFVAAFNELMAETVEMDGLPDRRVVLPSDNGLCLTPRQVLALEPFVEVADT